MRAFLSAFKWRLRSSQNLDTKFLHLLDSQVSISVLTKHRSSSIRLNRVARKVVALELASGSFGVFWVLPVEKESCQHAQQIVMPPMKVLASLPRAGTLLVGMEVPVGHAGGRCLGALGPLAHGWLDRTSKSLAKRTA